MLVFGVLNVMAAAFSASKHGDAVAFGDRLEQKWWAWAAVMNVAAAAFCLC